MNYPACIIKRLLYVGRYYSTFLPGAKRSISRERKGYERLYPGINEEAFRLLAIERTTNQKDPLHEPLH